MDAAAKKSVLRHCPYGLYVVTVAHGGEEHGMTANWVTQASFEPPMLAVAVENTAKTIGMIRDSHHFAVNVLRKGQRDLAGKLGRTSEQAPHKLKGIKTKPGPAAETPVLADSLGWVECRLVTTLPAGDHTIVLGEIMEAGVEHEDEALTLHDAGFSYSG
jgi:flavin reductase (DIM6/NTAB) family NADH-FMN oxidoreductase RutF